MTPQHTVFSWHRLAALCRKEAYQIIRDPSSIIICFVIPVILLVVFGYGINFDSAALRVGVVLEDQSPQARRFASTFSASPFIEARLGNNRQEMTNLMQAGKLRGIIIIPTDFARQLSRTDHMPSGGAQARPSGRATIQVITDGSEPNIANFVHAYVNGIWQTWQQQTRQDRGLEPIPTIDAEVRFWFNQAAVSRNFIIPGAITIIITVIGAILTSLVIAREWERGTMEALLSTRVTKAELLLSKLLPYYILGILALIVCMIVSVGVFKVPFRGSIFTLWWVSSLFLANTLGMGLLISTLTRNQFNAAQIALNAAFLPAIMLSGFVFEIDSMPAIVRAVTYLIPARYYVSVMHTLFLAGDVPYIIFVNSLFLVSTASLMLALTVKKTRLRLE